MIYEFVNPNKGFYVIFVPLKFFFPGKTGIAYHIWKEFSLLLFFFGEIDYNFSHQKLNTISRVIWSEVLYADVSWAITSKTRIVKVKAGTQLLATKT